MMLDQEPEANQKRDSDKTGRKTVVKRKVDQANQRLELNRRFQ